MKPHKLFLTAIVLLLSLSNRTIAQTDPLYPMIFMQMTVSGADTLSGGEISISDSTLFNAKMRIELFDTVGISKIHVVLRTTASSPDLLQQDYDFAAAPRNKYCVNLDLGSYKGLLHYYGEAVVEKIDGSLTDAFKDWR